MGVFKKDDGWYIDYYVRGKRRREKAGPNKRVAKLALEKRKIEIAEGKFLDIKKNEKIKFEDFSETYLELHSRLNKKPMVVVRDVILIKNLSTHFAGKYLYNINPLMIERYKMERGKEVSPATVNRELACLKSIFNKAIEWERAEDNPVRKVKFLKENNQRLRYLEEDEIGRLLDNCDDALRNIVIVALHTGMRRGEILGLQWRDIDLNKGIIYLLETKNNEKREVHMDDLVMKTLSSMQRDPESPYVFCDKDGKPNINLRRNFETALKNSGINEFRFHDLRHTYASYLVMFGIDIRTVQVLMGHKTIEMTLRYSHLSPDHKRRAVDVFGKRMDTYWSPEIKIRSEIKSIDNCNTLISSAV
ncbi:MAG: site-specific integrase [Candidatus Ancaeobacter aquaticus]|nr:site-specific integrase [Candidatus Ancaeobacter aquaticus]